MDSGQKYQKVWTLVYYDCKHVPRVLGYYFNKTAAANDFEKITSSGQKCTIDYMYTNDYVLLKLLLLKDCIE